MALVSSEMGCGARTKSAAVVEMTFRSTKPATGSVIVWAESRAPLSPKKVAMVDVRAAFVIEKTRQSVIGMEGVKQSVIIAPTKFLSDGRDTQHVHIIMMP